jgi:hypothetical protein
MFMEIGTFIIIIHLILKVSVFFWNIRIYFVTPEFFTTAQFTGFFELYYAYFNHDSVKLSSLSSILIVNLDSFQILKLPLE